MKEADYTVEYNKVFINLASLLLGTSLIFVARVSEGDTASLLLLIASWVFWIISIYFGARAIGEISKITGEAEIEEKSNSAVNACDVIADRLNGASVAGRIRWQLFLFLAGFAALIANALFRVFS